MEILYFKGGLNMVLDAIIYEMRNLSDIVSCEADNFKLLIEKVKPIAKCMYAAINNIYHSRKCEEPQNKTSPGVLQEKHSPKTQGLDTSDFFYHDYSKGKRN